MIRLFGFVIFMYTASIFGASVTLYNDSPFELIAVVQASNGSFLGQKALHPGEQNNWSVDVDITQLDVPFDQSESITPYTVIWKCSYKGFYSMCSGVSPGASVSANTCAGLHYCEPKPKKKNGDQNTSCNDCKPLE